MKTLKIRATLVFLLISIQSFAQTVDFAITGEFQGKNIYVQNPLASDKINFCTTEIYLNEELIRSTPKTSAFVIELSHLQVGDPVFIKIVHLDGCRPKVINPQVIRSKSTFKFLNAYADAISIHWSTSGELPNGKFFIEHYKNRNWITIKTLNGKGEFDANQYTINPEHHTGDNKFRIKYLQNNGKIFFSRVFDYFHDVEPISFSPTLVDDKITLSRASDYAVIDTYGHRIAQGKGQVIDLNSLKEGLYFLHVDNREEKFVKK